SFYPPDFIHPFYKLGQPGQRATLQSLNGPVNIAVCQKKFLDNAPVFFVLESLFLEYDGPRNFRFFNRLGPIQNEFLNDGKFPVHAPSLSCPARYSMRSERFATRPHSLAIPSSIRAMAASLALMKAGDRWVLRVICRQAR